LSYGMIDEHSRNFEVGIPAFSLDAPGGRKAVN
jgi:uncharacterized protein affecting Mg2+/Co2+ transport